MGETRPADSVQPGIRETVTSPGGIGPGPVPGNGGGGGKGGVGLFGEEAYGPLHIGHKSDKHKFGTTLDGEVINSGHIHTKAYFFRDVQYDAPMDFQEREYPGPSSFPLDAKVHLVYDPKATHEWNGKSVEGMWKWYAEVPEMIVPERPPPPPPTTGDGPPPITGPTPGPTPATPPITNPPAGGSPATPGSGTPGTPPPGTPGTPGGTSPPGLVEPEDPKPGGSDGSSGGTDGGSGVATPGAGPVIATGSPDFQPTDAFGNKLSEMDPGHPDYDPDWGTPATPGDLWPGAPGTMPTPDGGYTGGGPDTSHNSPDDGGNDSGAGGDGTPGDNTAGGGGDDSPSTPGKEDPPYHPNSEYENKDMKKKRAEAVEKYGQPVLVSPPGINVKSKFKSWIIGPPGSVAPGEVLWYGPSGYTRKRPKNSGKTASTDNQNDDD